MPTEIERKFLVIGNDWRSLGQGTLYRQGYIAANEDNVVRVRISGERAFLTIKGKSIGIVRAEYEYPIPMQDAQEMLETLCSGPLIEKVRYEIVQADLVWVVDEFLGSNTGLVVAEVELSYADQPISLPRWVGQEVSHDARYFNSNLAKHPYTQWGL